MNEARAFKKAGLTEESDTKIKKMGVTFSLSPPGLAYAGPLLTIAN